MPLPYEHLTTKTLIPGELFADVGRTMLPARDGAGEQAWVFLSRGMERAGQRDAGIVVLFGGGRPEPPPQYPFMLFNTIYGYAKDEGQTVGPGDFTLLGGAGQIGEDRRITGFAYAGGRWDGTGGPAVPRAERRQDPLFVLPLLGDEGRAVHEYGHARILALLGEEARVHPFPWWFDPAREPVITLTGYEDATMLARTPRAHAPYLTAAVRAGEIEVTVVDHDCPRLHELLTTGPDVIALLLGFSPEVDATLIWRPGQTRIASTTSAGRGGVVEVRGDLALSGNHLTIGHARKAETMANVIEDGFAVVLGRRDWKRLLAAVKAGQPFRCRTGGDTGVRELAVRVKESRVRLPSGEVAEAPGGFHRYDPAASSPRRARRRPNVHLENLRLLTAQSDIAEALAAHESPAQAIALLSEEAEAVVSDALEGVEHGCTDLVLDVRLRPGAPLYVTFYVRPGAFPADAGQRLVNRLQTLPAPEVRTHEVRFHLNFTFPRDGGPTG